MLSWSIEHTDQQINLLSHIENSGDNIPEENIKKPANVYSFPSFLEKAKGSIKGLKNQD